MSNLDYLYKIDLPHRAFTVYRYLLDRANKDGECWPSVNNRRHKAVACHS